MKKKIQPFIQSLSILFGLTLLFSLISSFLYKTDILSTNSFKIFTMIIGILLFGISGFLLGRKIKKAALVHSLIVILFFTILFFVLPQEKSAMVYIGFLLKMLSYGLCCVMGLNTQS